MGLFSTVSNKIHQKKLKKAQKEAINNRKLVLKYLALKDREEELEKARKVGLSDKGRALLAQIKAEKIKVRNLRIAKAKKVARIAGAVAKSIAKDIHKLGASIEKKKPVVKKKRKRRRKKLSKGKMLRMSF